MFGTDKVVSARAVKFILIVNNKENENVYFKEIGRFW
jgi:hypothetical protein